MLVPVLPPSGRQEMMTQGGSLGLDEMGNEPREVDGWGQGDMQMSLGKAVVRRHLSRGIFGDRRGSKDRLYRKATTADDF